MAKALTLSGSIRKDSHNGRLATSMGAKLSIAGLEVNNIDLKDYQLTLFNADVEQTNGEPQAAIDLARMFSEADVIFIASPEYNGSLSPLLKNTLDWISRQKFKAYSRAVFAIGSASPGKLGGIGGLGHLRDILNRLGALVVPMALGVGNANSAFDGNGLLVDGAIEKRAQNIVAQLTSTSRNF